MNDFIKNNPSRPPNDNLKIFNQQNMEEEIRKIVEINVKKVLDSFDDFFHIYPFRFHIKRSIYQISFPLNL